MKCAFCQNGYRTCNQCGGSGADGCVCANGSVLCNNCGGTGSLEDPATAGSSQGASVKEEPKKIGILLQMVVSLLFLAMLGPGGLAIWFIIWATIVFVKILLWISSIGGRLRKRNAPKLD